MWTHENCTDSMTLDFRIHVLRVLAKGMFLFCILLNFSFGIFGSICWIKWRGIHTWTPESRCATSWNEKLGYFIGIAPQCSRRHNLQQQQHIVCFSSIEWESDEMANSCHIVQNYFIRFNRVCVCVLFSHHLLRLIGVAQMTLHKKKRSRQIFKQEELISSNWHNLRCRHQWFPVLKHLIEKCWRKFHMTDLNVESNWKWWSP